MFQMVTLLTASRQSFVELIYISSKFSVLFKTIIVGWNDVV